MRWVSHGVCLVLQIFPGFRHGSRTSVNVLRAHQAGRGLATFLGIQARWNCSSFPSILWDGWQRLQVSCDWLIVTTHTSQNSGLKVLSRRAVFATFLGLYKELCCSRHTIPSPVRSTYYREIHFIVTIILQDWVTCEITVPFKFRKIKLRHMMIATASPAERRSHVSGEQCFPVTDNCYVPLITLPSHQEVV